MTKFEERDGKLFIDRKEVVKGFESMRGWFWFPTEKVQEQVSVINGRHVKDTIWFGLVRGFEEEWEAFSQAELDSLNSQVWELPKKALPWSGRREVET